MHIVVVDYVFTVAIVVMKHYHGHDRRKSGRWIAGGQFFET
jgi:hypothetical protein